MLAKEKITVFHAGSLAVPFADVEKAFEAKYPQYDVQREASGSRAAARKISEISRAADVMASADYKVINNLLIPNNSAFPIYNSTSPLSTIHSPNFTILRTKHPVTSQSLTLPNATHSMATTSRNTSLIIIKITIPPKI